jgi:hypothetical protein
MQSFCNCQDFLDLETTPALSLPPIIETCQQNLIHIELNLVESLYTALEGSDCSHEPGPAGLNVAGPEPAYSAAAGWEIAPFTMSSFLLYSLDTPVQVLKMATMSLDSAVHLLMCRAKCGDDIFEATQSQLMLSLTGTMRPFLGARLRIFLCPLRLPSCTLQDGIPCLIKP